MGSRFFSKLWKRVYYLTFECQFDLTKAANAALLAGMGAVLLSDPGYINTSPVLSQLGRYRTSEEWAAILLAVGLSEFILLFLTGKEPLFAENEKQALYWHVAAAAGFTVCSILYGALGKILSPVHGGVGFGTVFFGVAVCGSLYGSLRTGRTIAVDCEKCRLSLLEAIAKSNLSSEEIFLAVKM